MLDTFQVLALRLAVRVEPPAAIAPALVAWLATVAPCAALARLVRRAFAIPCWDRV